MKWTIIALTVVSIFLMFFDIENILMNYVHLIEFDTFITCNLQHQLIYIYIHIVSLIFPLCFLFFNVDIAFKSMDFQMAQDKKKRGKFSGLNSWGRTAAWWWDMWNRLSRELRLASEKAWCLRQSLSQCLMFDEFAGISTDVWGIRCWNRM